MVTALLSTVHSLWPSEIWWHRFGSTHVQVPGNGRNRPILAKAPSKEQRDKILENTKALREASPSYRRIYVKKDVHPAIRKEWKRLRDVEAAEKAKPVNQGWTIQLDYKRREVTRDGVVIDKWSPVLI